LEYWSVDFKDKEEGFEISKLFKVLFLLKNRIIEFFHYSITPVLQYSKEFSKGKDRSFSHRGRESMMGLGSYY